MLFRSMTPWTATGAEFAVPYVFKTLFSKSKINFNDLCVTKSVNTTLYLDMNENLEDVSEYEKELKKLKKEENPNQTRITELEKLISQGHNYVFVGKIGQFCPILPGCGGGELMTLRGESDYYAVQGTKGYRFLESETIKNLGREEDINEAYFIEMANESINHIAEFGDYDEFIG